MANSNATTISKARLQSDKTALMVKTGLMIAITLIMGLTPLGTIRTPFLSVSLVTVPVAIAAMLIGWQGALICGTVFGLTSFINALTGASGMLSTLFTVNPAGVFITAVIARVLMGLCTGLIFYGLHDKAGLKKISYYVAGLAAPLLNTLFFMTSLILFFYGSDFIQNLVNKFQSPNAFAFVISLVGVQGLFEAAAGCIVAGTVGLLVAKALKRA